MVALFTNVLCEERFVLPSLKKWSSGWRKRKHGEDAERSALLRFWRQTEVHSWTENWSKCIRLLYAFLLLTIILNHILLIFILEQGMVYKIKIWSQSTKRPYCAECKTESGKDRERKIAEF